MLYWVVSKFNYFYYKEKRFDKLTPREQEDLVFDLINAFSLMKNPIDTALLMQDLLTESEVRNLAKRLRIAKLALSGMTTDQIIAEMHCSAATVTKVRMWLANAGVGLKKVIQMLPRRRKIYRPKRIPGMRGYDVYQSLLTLTTAYLTEKERKHLEKFLEEMRAKSATDQDFREELAAQFSERKHTQSKLKQIK